MTTDEPATVQPLLDEEIDQCLASHPDWIRSGEAIQRTCACGDFVAAMAFVNRVATLAELACHHPDILVRYAKVTLTLSTHDAGGITEKDFALAASIDACFGDSAD